MATRNIVPIEIRRRRSYTKETVHKHDLDPLQYLSTEAPLGISNEVASWKASCNSTFPKAMLFRDTLDSVFIMTTHAKDKGTEYVNGAHMDNEMKDQLKRGMATSFEQPFSLSKAQKKKCKIQLLLLPTATAEKDDDLVRVLRELTAVQIKIADLEVELRGRKDSDSSKPAIFAMLNPTAEAECTAADAFKYAEDNIVFASGNPCQNVDLGIFLYHRSYLKCY